MRLIEISRRMREEERREKQVKLIMITFLMIGIYLLLEFLYKGYIIQQTCMLP